MGCGLGCGDTTDFDAALWSALVEKSVGRVVYKRDVEDHSYSLRTPNSTKPGAFSGFAAATKK